MVNESILSEYDAARRPLLDKEAKEASEDLAQCGQAFLRTAGVGIV